MRSTGITENGWAKKQDQKPKRGMAEAALDQKPVEQMRKMED